MTLNFRLIILYALVLFGAYSVQQAKEDVKKIRQRENSIQQHSKDSTLSDIKFLDKARYR